MKKIVFILLAAFAVTASYAQSEKKPKIEFEKSTIDL